MILANQLIQRMQVHHHLIPLSRFQPNSEAIGVARRFHAPCSSNSRFSNDGSCQKMTSSQHNTADVRTNPLGVLSCQTQSTRTASHLSPGLWPAASLAIAWLS